MHQPLTADTLPRHSPIIIIPALDEEASIASVLDEIRTTSGFPVLVVDDCSQDATAAEAEAAGATVLRLPMRLGAWGAIQAGLRLALREGYQTAITMDADGQHESAYIADLLHPLRKGSAQVTIGAFPERGSLPRQIAWALFRRLSGFSIADLTSGFRAYNHRAMKLLASPEATLLDYQDMGVLQLLRSAGLAIIEVPVAMRLRKAGASRVFYSWWAVGLYMAHTLTLCFAHWRVAERQK